MKNKVIALLLSSAMVLSLVACGQGGETSKETSGQKESEGTKESVQKNTEDAAGSEESAADENAVDRFAGTVLNIAIGRSSNDKAEDFNEKPIIKAVEEATGIHVNWTIIPADGQKEKVGAMLASGEQPDAYISLLDENTVAGDTALFYDMSDILQEYAPDAYAIHEENNLLPNIVFPDGAIYSLYTGPAVKGEGEWMMATQAINQDWLDALGLKAPTTKEEFKEVLIAFRDQDPNGNGEKDEIPVSFSSGLWDGEFLFFANNFGIAGQGESKEIFFRRLEDDGTVTPLLITDEMKAFVEFYHELYEEGLLDMEGFSQTSDQYYAKVNGNQVGVCVKYSFQAEDAAESTGRPYFVPMHYQGIEGVDIMVSGAENITGALKFGFVPSATANIEPLLHWWNYMHSTSELRILAHNGVSRVVEVDGKKYAKYYPAGHELTAPTLEVIHSESLWNSSPVYGAEDELTSDPTYWVDNNPRNAYIREVVVPNGWLNKNAWSRKTTDASKIEERANLQVEFVDQAYARLVEFVMNGITDKEWEDFKSEVDALGYGEWIQWWQDYVDNN